MDSNNKSAPVKNKKRYFLYAFLMVAFLTTTFLGGVALGSSLMVKNEIFSDSGEVEISKVINLYSKTRSEEINFEQYWEIWNKIKKSYVDQPVDEVDLFYGSLVGMVAALGDPHSVYFPPVEATEFSKNLAGEFEGIGAEIGIRDGQLTIIAPLPESPAEKAGLTSGDKIDAIDGEDTAGMEVDIAVSKIRGPGGTEVKLTITHNGFETIEDVIIKRDKINVPTIAHRVIEDTGIVYLRISYFNQDTWFDFDKAVREVLEKSPKGLILDLRSNPGGYLETAIDVASEWVRQGIIVTEKNGQDVVLEHKSRGAHRFVDLPTVVLVDEGSASGSEIVAGALQDHGVAEIVGATTFGKGSVQDFEVLSDGSGLKLTIAKWFTPSDRVIDGKGIEPDIVLEEMFTPVYSEEKNAEGGFDIVDVVD